MRRRESRCEGEYGAVVKVEMVVGRGRGAERGEWEWVRCVWGSGGVV